MIWYHQGIRGPLASPYRPPFERPKSTSQLPEDMTFSVLGWIQQVSWSMHLDGSLVATIFYSLPASGSCP